MDIFGISSAKIILILIIAIVLLGPDQVPGIVKTVGKTIRDFRRFVNETTKEFNEVTGDLRKEFTESVGDLRSEIAATQAELKTQFDLSEVVSPITSALRDPIGALTAPMPEAVAVGAVAASESQTQATESVPYTPPQSILSNFTNPAPETLSEPAPDPLVVQTSYAESLAASNGHNGAHDGATDTMSATVHVNGNGNGNGNGHAVFGIPRATKADPFADLVVLAPSAAPALPPLVSAMPLESPAQQETVVVQDTVVLGSESASESGLASIPVVTAQATPAAEAVIDAPAPATPRKSAVGGSVAGTKYGRKRVS